MCGFGRSHRVTWRGERARACELGGWENRGLRGGGGETLRGRDVGRGVLRGAGRPRARQRVPSTMSRFRRPRQGRSILTVKRD